jgi:20S proteasome alpha/beta subunit
MTLIAGFRCSDGGVLLCADREQSDQSAKRQVDKIFRITTTQGTFLVAGAGRASIVDNAFMRLDSALKDADARKNNLFDTHVEEILTVLHGIHEDFIWGERNESNNRTIRLIIAASF